MEIDSRLLTAISERRSLRALAPEPPPDDDIALLFEAARWAPSAGNGQPWRFVITRRGSAAFEALAATLSRGNGWATRAPLLVLSAARKEHVHPSKPPKTNRLALLDLGLALGNLVTQATELGLVAHPMAGFDREAAILAMGVPPGYEVGVVLAVGYPGDSEDLDPDHLERDRRPRWREPLMELVFEGEWGKVAGFAVDETVPDGRGANES